MSLDYVVISTGDLRVVGSIPGNSYYEFLLLCNLISIRRTLEKRSLVVLPGAK